MAHLTTCSLSLSLATWQHNNHCCPGEKCWHNNIELYDQIFTPTKWEKIAQPTCAIISRPGLCSHNGPIYWPAIKLRHHTQTSHQTSPRPVWCLAARNTKILSYLITRQLQRIKRIENAEFRKELLHDRILYYHLCYSVTLHRHLMGAPGHTIPFVWHKRCHWRTRITDVRTLLGLVDGLYSIRAIVHMRILYQIEMVS